MFGGKTNGYIVDKVQRATRSNITVSGYKYKRSGFSENPTIKYFLAFEYNQENIDNMNEYNKCII